MIALGALLGRRLTGDEGEEQTATAVLCGVLWFFGSLVLWSGGAGNRAPRDRGQTLDQTLSNNK